MLSQAVIDSRAQQIAALESSKGQATQWPGPGPKPATYTEAADIQNFIDQLKAFWALQDESAKPKPPAPPIVPAASDAWRDAEPGSIITMAGVNYEVIGSPFGNMIRKLKTPPAPIPVTTVAEERIAMAGYIRAQLAADDDEKVQTALIAQLTWLGKRP